MKPEPTGKLPYYKRYPGDFLGGIAHMTVEQIAVYAVLLDLMYDGWETIEDRTVKQRRDLARTCGLSVRKFGTTLGELVALDKIQRTLSGRLSNRKFEQLAAERGFRTEKPEKNPKNTRDNRIDNRPDNEHGSNETNGLEGENSPVHARAKLEARSYNSTVPAQDLSDQSVEVIESEISRICSAIGVQLTSSTARAGWPMQWVRMRTELNITVDDMVAAISTFTGQLRGETVKSLGLYKDRAIEKRQARELNDRLAGRAAAAAVPVSKPDLDQRQWFDELRRFLDIGLWMPANGPSPLMPGCFAPHDLLDKAQAKWIEQGNHPAQMHHGGAKEPWRPGKAGMVQQVTPFAAASTRSKE